MPFFVGGGSSPSGSSDAEGSDGQSSPTEKPADSKTNKPQTPGPPQMSDVTGSLLPLPSKKPVGTDGKPGGDGKPEGKPVPDGKPADSPKPIQEDKPTEPSSKLGEKSDGKPTDAPKVDVGEKSTEQPPPIPNSKPLGPSGNFVTEMSASVPPQLPADNKPSGAKDVTTVASNSAPDGTLAGPNGKPGPGEKPPSDKPADSGM